MIWAPHEILGIVRLGQLTRKKNEEFRLELIVPFFEIEFHWRSRKSLWGRFGGGWNWDVGVKVGTTTVIFGLLIATLRISKKLKVKV